MEDSDSRVAAEPTHELLPGLEFLGYGIDVRGRVLQNKPQIYDLGPRQQYVAPNGKTYLQPEGVDVISTASLQDATIVAESSSQWQRQYSGSLGLSGSYEGFSAEFNASFSYDEERFESSYYASKTALMQAWGLRINNRAQLNLQVTGLIKELADAGKWSELFDTYGTHYVATSSAGGRFSIVSTIEKASSLSSYSVKTAITAKYEMFFKASASFDTSGLDQNFESKAVTSISVVGGAAEANSTALSSPAAFSAWLKSTSQFPVLINYPLNSLQTLDPAGAVTEGALVPIWTILNKDKWQAAQAAFDAAMKQDVLDFVVVGAATNGSGHRYGRIEVDGVNYFDNKSEPTLTFVIFDLTGDFKRPVLNRAFNCYDNPAQAGEIIKALTPYFEGSYLVMIASGDSGWREDPLDGGLIDTLAKFGANKAQLVGNRDRREPFALLGRSRTPGSAPVSPGNGTSLRGPGQGADVAIGGVLIRGTSDKTFRAAINSVVGA